MRKKIRIHERLWTPVGKYKEGDELEYKDSIYVVKAILAERIIGNLGGGTIESYILVEYVCTIIERLQNDILELKKEVEKLKKKEGE